MHKTPLVPLRLQVTGMVTIPRDVQLHQHPVVELVYYLKGHVHCRVGEQVFDCRPGMMVTIPPHVIHGEKVLETFTCVYILLETPPYLPWPQLYIDDAHGTFANLCSVLVRESNGQAPDREAMIDTLIQQCDILLRRANDQHNVPAAERLVQEGERLLKERFSSQLTIGELAATLDVSPSYLRAQFVRLRGQTPKAYLQALRVQHAVAMIRNSDLSLEAVARLCGYDSSSHLSRHVMRATGQRPGAFRLKSPLL
jgi:AraC-like DNA-binding protein